MKRGLRVFVCIIQVTRCPGLLATWKLSPANGRGLAAGTFGPRGLLSHGPFELRTFHKFTGRAGHFYIGIGHDIRLVPQRRCQGSVRCIALAQFETGCEGCAKEEVTRAGAEPRAIERGFGPRKAREKRPFTGFPTVSRSGDC